MRRGRPHPLVGIRAIACAIVAATVLGAAPPTRAADSSPALYQATVIVTGYDMRSRPYGFAKSLEEVLVRVSGDPRLAGDPRVTALGKHAGDLVTTFSYVDQMAGIPPHDDQGTYDRSYNLTVRFDPARIDGILASFGRRPWRGERPVIVPVVRVRGPRPPSYLLDAETPRGAEQRRSLATVAHEYAMSIAAPSRAELGAWQVPAHGFPTARTPNPQTLTTQTPATPGRIVVAGMLEWSETLPGWVATWRTHWHGTDHTWAISGVNYDTAFRDMVRGVVLLASGNGAPD